MRDFFEEFGNPGFPTLQPTDRPWSEEKGQQPSLEEPIELPLLPLRDLVLFPRMVIPLFVGRSRSLAAIEAAIESDGLLVAAAQKDPEVERPGPEDIYPIGTEVIIG
ncbi:MAG TPA: endopeptidase La, partial [Chloroflexi bacterium]|nr:endopeptidase La [Chloroflexota bacterium]